MIRVTELALALDHPAEALRHAIVERLKIKDADLLDFTVFKRSYDARKKNSEIKFVYILDLKANNEERILARFGDDIHIRPAPDTNYYPVGHAPEGLTERPLVVGFGPCGLFAALNRLCWNAVKMFAAVLKIPGRSGATRCFRRNRMYSLVKAAQVYFQTANSTAK
jgi:uncharacterized FAD-dependent dehydrogenase